MFSTCPRWVGKCGSAVGAGCPTVADSEAIPKFTVIEQMGSIVPEVLKGRTSTLLVFSARVRDYDQVMTLLVDLGVSQNFVKFAALEKRPSSYESLCQNGKRQEVTVRLANGALVKNRREFKLNLPSALVTSLVKRSSQC